MGGGGQNFKLAAGASKLMDNPGLGVLVGVALAFGTQLPPAANCRLPGGGAVGSSYGPPGGGNGRSVGGGWGPGDSAWLAAAGGIGRFVFPFSCPDPANSRPDQTSPEKWN